MNTVQQALYVCYAVAVVLTVCSASPAWRPQGRFGKRGDKLAAAGQDLAMPQLTAVPVELFYNPRELRATGFRPRLCSVTGVEGYPACTESHEKVKNILDEVLQL